MMGKRTLFIIFSFILLASLGQPAEAANWIGIPPWEIQRDISVTGWLKLSTNQPSSGETVSAEFTIRNNSQNTYTFNKIGVAARGPQCYNLGCGKVVDFPFQGRTTLAPGQSFTYRQQRQFSANGDYFAQLAFQLPTGAWYSMNSSANFKVQGGSANGVQIVAPIKLDTTHNRVNDIFYATFTLHNPTNRAVTYKQIGVGVRGPNCGQAFTCGAIADFPADKNVTIPANGSYTSRNWQQLAKAGSYTMQVAVLNSSHRWEFLGEKSTFNVQPATNARRGNNFRMAAHYHPRWNESDINHLNLAKSAGIDLVRVAVEWRRLQPDNANSYDQWYSDRLAEFLQRANNQGVGVYLMVSASPCWASADPAKNCQWGRYNGTYPPSNPQHYANIMRELVRRHGHQVVAWEVWNEPNIGRFWATPNPVAYTELLKAAHGAIKSQRGNAVVLGGSLAGTDFDFLMGMYAQGANKYYDALAIHPYTRGAPDDCSTNLASFYCGVEGLRAMMIHNHDYRPLWFTEYGWSGLNGNGGVGEYNQQQYFIQSLNRIKTWDFVPVVTWYNLIDTNFDKGAPAFEHHMGLFRANGQPKPIASWLRANPQ